MRIQAFVFNWNDHRANAAELERKIGRHAGVTVVNSQEGLEAAYPAWDHLDDTAYFSAQFNRAVELFNTNSSGANSSGANSSGADLFFHIQADAGFDDFADLFARMERVFREHPVGVYEPNVDYTDLDYDRSKLRTLEPDLCVVPTTDCTCWCIDRATLAALPVVDLSLNRLGWGICGAVAALSRRAGKHCIRDYAFTVAHPKGRGYSNQQAKEELSRYVGSFDAEIRQDIASAYAARPTLMAPRRP